MHRIILSYTDATCEKLNDPLLFSCCAAAHGRLFDLLSFLIFNDFYQTSYLKIYRIDLRQIFRVGISIVVYDQSENIFSFPQGTLPWQTISAGFIHTIEFRWHSVMGACRLQSVRVAGCKRLVAQSGGLMLGFALHLWTTLCIVSCHVHAKTDVALNCAALHCAGFCRLLRMVCIVRCRKWRQENTEFHTVQRRQNTQQDGRFTVNRGRGESNFSCSSFGVRLRKWPICSTHLTRKISTSCDLCSVHGFRKKCLLFNRATIWLCVSVYLTQRYDTIRKAILACA